MEPKKMINSVEEFITYRNEVTALLPPVAAKSPRFVVDTNVDTNELENLENNFPEIPQDFFSVYWKFKLQNLSIMFYDFTLSEFEGENFTEKFQNANFGEINLINNSQKIINSYIFSYHSESYVCLVTKDGEFKRKAIVEVDMDGLKPRFIQRAPNFETFFLTLANIDKLERDCTILGKSKDEAIGEIKEWFGLAINKELDIQSWESEIAAIGD